VPDQAPEPAAEHATGAAGAAGATGAPADDRTRERAIDNAIRQLARAVVKHPIAAQAAYRALVREGRAFAQTDDGRRIQHRLAGSELVARLRTAWELVTFGMLREESPPGALPSVLIEALVQAVLRDRFEARVHDAMVPRSPEER
jgi:hypothetical protein